MAALRTFLTRRSFERRTRELVTPLYRAARALTDNETDAEDLVQDAYIKGFLAFREGEFSSVASCRAWLFRIMVNTFRDHYRRRTRMPEMELVVFKEGPAGTDGETPATDVIGPDLLVEANFLREAIVEAVCSLPPEVRIVVTLFFIEGMKYREIAEVADCPIGTVMSRVARGRQILQSTLAAGWRPDVNPVGPRIPKARTRI
jgi:RNA polymerase sigma-70 factor, ECF subfamily